MRRGKQTEISYHQNYEISMGLLHSTVNLKQLLLFCLGIFLAILGHRYSQ